MKLMKKEYISPSVKVKQICTLDVLAGSSYRMDYTDTPADEEEEIL